MTDKETCIALGGTWNDVTNVCIVDELVTLNTTLASYNLMIVETVAQCPVDYEVIAMPNSIVIPPVVMPNRSIEIDLLPAQGKVLCAKIRYFGIYQESMTKYGEANLMPIGISSATGEAWTVEPEPDKPEGYVYLGKGGKSNAYLDILYPSLVTGVGYVSWVYVTQEVYDKFGKITKASFFTTGKIVTFLLVGVGVVILWQIFKPKKK